MKDNQLRPFHLAIPVSNLDEAREFYGNLLGLAEGRSSSHWIDYNFFGHQLVCHLSQTTNQIINNVDGQEIPVPHFGVVLSWEQFEDFSQSLADKKINFIIEPYLRFKDKPGEQLTMFLKDPFGNAIEFKAFKNDKDLFKAL